MSVAEPSLLLADVATQQVSNRYLGTRESLYRTVVLIAVVSAVLAVIT
jgi:hypothetical protein